MAREALKTSPNTIFRDRFYWGSMTVADVNRDGKPDLIVASGAPSSNGSVASPDLTVFTGNGDCTFKQGASYAEAKEIVGMVAADFRRTGTPDLVEQTVSAAASANQAAYQSAMTIRAGNGDGTFQTPRPLRRRCFLSLVVRNGSGRLEPGRIAGCGLHWPVPPR